jgi:hypothetical protein
MTDPVSEQPVEGIRVTLCPTASTMSDSSLWRRLPHWK